LHFVSACSSGADKKKSAHVNRLKEKALMKEPFQHSGARLDVFYFHPLARPAVSGMSSQESCRSRMRHVIDAHESGSHYKNVGSL